MKKFLKIESLTQLDPPKELDRRILVAAQSASVRRRWQRRMRRVLSAAAALLLIGGGVLLAPRRAGSAAAGLRPDREQLLAMADWSNVEQDVYNLSGELNAEHFGDFMEI